MKPSEGRVIWVKQPSLTINCKSSWGQRFTWKDRPSSKRRTIFRLLSNPKQSRMLRKTSGLRKGNKLMSMLLGKTRTISTCRHRAISLIATYSCKMSRNGSSKSTTRKSLKIASWSNSEMKGSKTCVQLMLNSFRRKVSVQSVSWSIEQIAIKFEHERPKIFQ